ncbi:MAG: hypothetical protein MMC23_001225 [Stictis urceolatum]|nr:hypothetical protein [Stictis urceolata]
MSPPAFTSALQRTEQNTDSYQALVPRREKQLSIKTNLPAQNPPPTDPLPTVQRPPPVETVIYKISPDRPAPPQSLVEHASRRTSKLGLRGIFGKSKGLKNSKNDRLLESSTVEEAETSSHVSADSPFFQPPPQEPAKEKAQLAKLKSVKKERPPRPLMTWDPPPLFQAFPQALKTGTLTAPVLPADSVLRMHKERSAYEDKTIPGSSLVADWHDYPSDDEARQGKRSYRRQPSSFVECGQKIYVLTTSGFMLQYSSEGSHDRLPERIMQLGKDSAAFASDAIPGKHWVLQISQSTCDEGAATNEARKSVFSKFGLGNGLKRPVSTYLLVMKSAAEMDSWLVAMRREIQSLGGKTYRPDEALRSTCSSEGAMQRLRERSSRRFLVESDPSQHSGNVSPLSPRVLSHRSSMAIGQSRRGYGPDGLAKKPSATSPCSNDNFVQSLEVPRPGSAGPSLLGRRASSGALFPSPTTIAPDTDKALPARPAHKQSAPLSSLSPINALGIVASDKGYGWAGSSQSSLGEFRKEASTPSISRSKHRSMMPISNYNTGMKKYEEEASLSESKGRQSSIGSLESTRAPNFSVPSFSRRYPLKQSSGDRATSFGSTATSRGRTPSLTDGESSARPESVVGDLPASVRSVQRPIFQGHAEVAVAVSMSPVRAKQVENELPEIVPIPPDQAPKIPKRMSSLEYTSGVLPWNFSGLTSSTAQIRSSSCSPRPQRISSLHTQAHSSATPPLLEPPHPAPTSALPALPSSAEIPPVPSSTVEPSPAAIQSEVSAIPSLRRPCSMQFSEPSPRRVKPAASMSTFKMPVAPQTTIQERRMLLGKNNMASLPPPLPPPIGALPPPPTLPPSGPLPPIPGTEAAPGLQRTSREGSKSVGPAIPLTPPTQQTPPSLARSAFVQDQRLPDSPPNEEEAELRESGSSTRFIPEMRQMSPLKSGFEIPGHLPRSPASESWTSYLQGAQASRAHRELSL